MKPTQVHCILFGTYVLATGLALLFVPTFLLGLLRMPVATEPWIMIAAGIALALGYYYVAAGRADAGWFYRASVGGRLAFASVAFLTAWTYHAPAFVLFGAVDAVTAGIMAWQIRGERQ